MHCSFFLARNCSRLNMCLHKLTPVTTMESLVLEHLLLTRTKSWFPWIFFSRSITAVLLLMSLTPSFLFQFSLSLEVHGITEDFTVDAVMI